ncbi:MAG: HAD-IIIA family hydrolase [Candidatus Omnitrophica bacterium]|nr:HAD-IIIA family hydrolase [Candidatus Omnitrophota bacterium]
MIDSLKKKLKKIKVLALDVDGVLTNGKINVDERGKEIKVFDVHDGFGLAMIRRAGFKTAIISARSAGAVTARARDLKIDQVFQGAYPKTAAFEQLLRVLKVSEDQVCFMGDDIPDLIIFRRVGVAVAVKNANAEVKKHVDYVTKRNGGDGAVREIVELILKTQNKWKELLKHYHKG